MSSCRTLSNYRVALSAMLIGALALLTGCGANKPVLPDLPITQTEYRLDHGDHLQITVYGQDELTGSYVVDGSGEISMPLIGAVSAGGGTTDDLEARIADKLKPKYLNDPNVAVQVTTYRPFYIVGEVKNPGSYPYVDGMVVMTAVALARGFTYRAREDQFYITRSLDPDRQLRAANPDSPVMPGDLITVRERYF
ncbi:polysaccharide biosynthesis/export family protein [Thalassobaculum sp.]|uniref:polysaccharide biosynthesis/export family protein n=1 Tax=Thalassobaculum sp. TaxID=2022740 RepID=UPI0032EAAF3A